MGTFCAKARSWWSGAAAAGSVLAVSAILLVPQVSVAAPTSTTPTATIITAEDPQQPRDVLNVAYGPLPEQVLDVHLPLGAGPFPVVVFAHSGGWVGGTRSDIPDVIRALVGDLDVAVVTIDYRLVALAPDGTYVNTFPTASYDVDRAIRFVRANATRWDLDRERVIVAGSSAGGQLAALAGAAPGVYRDPTLSDDLVLVSPEVQGVIDYVGPSDLRSFPLAGGWGPGLTAAFLGCAPGRPETCDPARAAEASAATHLGPAPPPAYLAYGEQDGLVLPATQGAPLADAWTAARGERSQPDPRLRGVWYEQAPDAGHNFDLHNSDYLAMEGWLQSVIAGKLA